MTSADMYYTLCILSEFPYLDYLVALLQPNRILIIGSFRRPLLKLFEIEYSIIGYFNVYLL